MSAELVEEFSDQEMSVAVTYLLALRGGEVPVVAVPEGEMPAGPAPELTDEEFTWAKQTYFERCAGCHGTLRKGATGPALTPDLTLPKGTVGLAAIIFNGTTARHARLGQAGRLHPGTDRDHGQVPAD